MNETGRQPVVILEGVSFDYYGLPVLTDVNAHINHRDFVSVVGPNGGGKTTLLRLILGLLQPAAGTIRVFGLAPEAARPRVGYVPQHFLFDPQFPIRVLDVVLTGCLNEKFFGRYRKADREKALQALAEVELDNLAGRHMAELSGGQRQRVLIARSLAIEPELLLLDEPMAHVDMAAQKEVFAFLQRLNQRLTIVMVTHDIGFAAPFVTSVLCVNRRVAIHPTQRITGEIIAELYGTDVRLISHDHTTCPHPDDCERCAQMRQTIENLRSGREDRGERNG